MTATNPKSFDNWSYQVFLSTLTALDGKHEIILMGEHSFPPGVNINVPPYLLVMSQDKTSKQKAMLSSRSLSSGRKSDRKDGTHLCGDRGTMLSAASRRTC